MAHFSTFIWAPLPRTFTITCDWLGLVKVCDLACTISLPTTYFDSIYNRAYWQAREAFAAVEPKALLERPLPRTMEPHVEVDAPLLAVDTQVMVPAPQHTAYLRALPYAAQCCAAVLSLLTLTDTS